MPGTGTAGVPFARRGGRSRQVSRIMECKALDGWDAAAGFAETASPLSAEQARAVRERAERIDVHDPQALFDYGLASQLRLSDLAGQVVSRLGTQRRARRDVASLLTTLERLHPGRIPREPLRFGLSSLHRSLDAEQALVVRYERVSLKLQRLTPRLLDASRRLLEELADLDALVARSRRFAEDLELLAAAGRVRLEAESRPRQEPALAEALQALADRVECLEETWRVSLALAGRIQAIQRAQRALLDTLQRALLELVPRWNERLVAAIVDLRAQRNAELMQRVERLEDGLLDPRAVGSDSDGADRPPELRLAPAPRATEAPSGPQLERVVRRLRSLFVRVRQALGRRAVLLASALKVR